MQLGLSGTAAAVLADQHIDLSLFEQRTFIFQQEGPNWKRLLQDVRDLARRFDAQTLVIGLPLSLDGTNGSAAENVRRLAHNFALSLDLPVYLQDERLTSVEARASLLSEGRKPAKIPSLIDGEAAAIILRDFLRSTDERILVSRKPASEI